MSEENPVNVAASVRQRLLNISRESGEEFGLLLSRFAIERLLYRLSVSPHRASFLLKGAALFTVWKNVPRRPTRDVDFLGLGFFGNDVDSDVAAEKLAAIFRSLCEIEVPSDGLYFESGSVQVASIRDEQRYGGQRIRLESHLAQARIPLRVDVGFGDVVTPSARETEYPTLLSFPAPRLAMYPPETVIAEKYQAMVELGEGNSRMKDFYDVWILTQHQDFDGALLSRAIAATFLRRSTPIPNEMPESLREEFCRSSARVMQWRAFTRKNCLQESPEIHEIAGVLRAFLWPLTQSLQNGAPFSMRWNPKSGWQEIE